MPLADLGLLLALYLSTCLAICAWLELGSRPVPPWLRTLLTLYTTLFVAIAAAGLSLLARTREE